MHPLKALLLQKARFAATSSVATAVDYGLYVLLVYTVLPPVWSNVVSFSVAVGVNFWLQKRFVFTLRRRLSRAFLLAMAVSAGGLALSTGLIWGFGQHPFLAAHQYLNKLLVTGIVFFYNFYLKRYAFERRLFAPSRPDEPATAP
ncbi:MAG: GtrA family protein [Bacteroidetes bacterium]|nr:MAG: GtrA family protein [Bacteroidota bacterium]